MNCIFCDAEIGVKSFKNSYLVHCQKCGKIYNTKIGKQVSIEAYEQGTLSDSPPEEMTPLPDFSVKEIVTCTDPRHPLFLEYGYVTKLDFMHIRIKFQGRMLWMPEQIVVKVPKEWL